MMCGRSVFHSYVYCNPFFCFFHACCIVPKNLVDPFTPQCSITTIPAVPHTTSRIDGRQVFTDPKSRIDGRQGLWIDERKIFAPPVWKALALGARLLKQPVLVELL